MTLCISGSVVTIPNTNNSRIGGFTMNSPSYAIGLLGTTYLTGIAGNLLMIFAHVKDPLKLIKSLSSRFIFNIALVDLLLSSALLLVVFSFTNSFCVPGIASSVTFLLYIVSFALYLSLAIQRFCSVAFPLWHCVNITTRVCRYWVASIWLTYIVLISGRFMVLSLTQMRVDIAFVALMWLMFFLTQCINIASCTSIRRQNRELECRQGMDAATERTIKIRLRNESNFVRTIAIISFIRGVLTLPFLTMAFEITLSFRLRSEKDDKYVIQSYYIWSLLGNGVNSAINVFVCIWRLPNYRKTFKKIYCCCSK